jgi:hypothetical protein
MPSRKSFPIASTTYTKHLSEGECGLLGVRCSQPDVEDVLQQCLQA